jgi:MFS family permease
MIGNTTTRPTSLPKTGQAILQIPFGLASDRWGRKPVPPRRQMA